jgi:hypothetical protein
MAPTFDENIDIFTSCRDGPVHAEGELCMHELPVSGIPSIIGIRVKRGRYN